MKRCFYCNSEIESGSVVDICKSCMYQIWGKKMSETIISNMEIEKQKGNLELGKVGQLSGENENKLEIEKEAVIIQGISETTAISETSEIPDIKKDKGF